MARDTEEIFQELINLLRGQSPVRIGMLEDILLTEAENETTINVSQVHEKQRITDQDRINH